MLGMTASCSLLEDLLVRRFILECLFDRLSSLTLVNSVIGRNAKHRLEEVKIFRDESTSPVLAKKSHGAQILAMLAEQAIQLPGVPCAEERPYDLEVLEILFS